jgi:hypothetical protein
VQVVTPFARHKLTVRAAVHYKLRAKYWRCRKSIVGTEVTRISYRSVGFGWLEHCQIFLTNERNAYCEIKRQIAKGKRQKVGTLCFLLICLWSFWVLVKICIKMPLHPIRLLPFEICLLLFDFYE